MGRGGDVYMFYDADCDGKATRPRWMIDDSEPNNTAHHDLNGDGNCTRFAYTDTATAAFTPPSGDWQVYCNKVWTPHPLTIDTCPGCTCAGWCDTSTSPHINCKARALTTVPLIQNTGVEMLTLANNLITTLVFGIFKGLSNVTTL
jgi:hypothetical protein